VYQGKRNPKSYFEGWYNKLVNEAGDQIWSVIPGVSYSDDTHAFIQIIEALTGGTFYFRFPIETFSYRQDRMEIRIGENLFTSDFIELNIEDGDAFSMKGRIEYKDQKPFPQKLFSPGIMGWYSFVPRMECYHGVVSMTHQLNGELEINGKPVRFTGGKGYIEKDWGKSMPSVWIWMQSNHLLNSENSSFMLSVARIPWGSGFFPGFLSFLYVEGEVFRFATYNGSKIRSISANDKEILIEVQNRKHHMKISAIPNRSGMLKAPRHGNMDREIFESLNSSLKIELSDSKGKLIFQSRGVYAGLEVVGDIARYIT
jgi:hypothetical protein